MSRSVGEGLSPGLDEGGTQCMGRLLSCLLERLGRLVGKSAGPGSGV